MEGKAVTIITAKLLTTWHAIDGHQGVEVVCPLSLEEGSWGRDQDSRLWDPLVWARFWVLILRRHVTPGKLLDLALQCSCLQKGLPES